MKMLTDTSLRFLFDGIDVRGESVKLGSALVEMLGQQPYSKTVTRLLGEFASAAVLISNNLKYDGRIILQAKSSQAITLAMVECSSEGHIRGIAQGDIEQESTDPMSLLQGGQLALTIERDQGQRYQGIVALENGSLAEVLEAYFAQSEQLGAKFWLASDGQTSAGLMLQQLPAQLSHGAAREAQWHHLCTLAETISSAELLDLPSETLLFKLYHEETVTLYPPTPILFKCRCSRERSANTIALLPESEKADILAELGEITLTCELCGTSYRFGPEVMDTTGITSEPHDGGARTLH